MLRTAEYRSLARCLPDRIGEGCCLEQLEPRALLSLAVSDYFPLAQGLSWSYEGKYDGTAITVGRYNEARQTASGIDCTYQRTSHTLISPTGSSEAQYLRLDNTGLRLYGRDLGENGLNAYEVAPASGIRLLPATVELGQSYAYGGVMNGRLSTGHTFTDDFTGTITIVGEETITTSAGTFRALRVDRVGTENATILTGSGVEKITSHTTESQWLVLGFGLVRLERREFGDGFDDTTAFALVLSPQQTARKKFGMTGKQTVVVQGDSTPTIVDGTNYGGIDVAGATKTRVFVVRNSGTGTLRINSIMIGGANAAEFTLVRVPATTLAPGESTPFSIRFDPTATGFRFATVSISTNDPLARPFAFTIRGTGMIFGVINVRRSDKSAPVISGSTTATLATGTALGRTAAAGSAFIERTFIITNTGLGTLTFTGTPRVRVEGPGAASFAIAGPSAPSLAPGAAATFVVHFDPIAAGGFSVVLYIPSSDRWTPEFSFLIVGTGR